MVYPVSPYELLKRSKPKPPPAYVTDYDLYSAAQRPAPEPEIPQIKTHYVSGIHNRHAKAMKYAQMHSGVLSSPSHQTPST